MAELSVWRVLSNWPAIIFWPAIVAGLAAAGIGIAWRRTSLLIVGACLMLPAALYLAATPRFRFIGLVPVVSLFLAAWALRREKYQIGRVLVAAGVVFWSVVGSMLVFPLVLHLVVVGVVIALAGLGGFATHGQRRWRAAVYIPVSIAGAFIGALLSFGDTPLLMRYSVLNPSTLSVLAAVVSVTVVRLVARRITGLGDGKD